jgi:hypothetical protein
MKVPEPFVRSAGDSARVGIEERHPPSTHLYEAGDSLLAVGSGVEPGSSRTDGPSGKLRFAPRAMARGLDRKRRGLDR